MKLNIGLVDDHKLFVKSLALMINTFTDCETVLEAYSGIDLLSGISLAAKMPDIIMIDVQMGEMDGIQTATAVARQFPGIKLAALSTKDDDASVIAMLKAGCCAYLLKGIDSQELEKAIYEIGTRGFYNGDLTNINYRRLLLHEKQTEKEKLTEKEKKFVQLSCSDLTYKQVAVQMHLSERTIDGYRESVFEKFNVQSRVGMALEAIRRNLVTL